MFLIFILDHRAIFYVELAHFLRLCDKMTSYFVVLSLYTSHLIILLNNIFLVFFYSLFIFQVLLSGDFPLSHIFYLFQPFFLHSHPNINDVLYV